MKIPFTRFLPALVFLSILALCPAPTSAATVTATVPHMPSDVRAAAGIVLDRFPLIQVSSVDGDPNALWLRFPSPGNRPASSQEAEGTYVQLRVVPGPQGQSRVSIRVEIVEHGAPRPLTRVSMQKGERQSIEAQFARQLLGLIRRELMV